MAASVCCSLVLFLFLFVCPVLSNDFLISFTRNELLDIRNSTPDNLLPTFEHSDILVGGASFLFKSSRRRKRGKRAGALVKTRQRGLRTSLPSIHLANLRSLANKPPHPHKQGLFKLCCALFHGNLAERSYPGQRASSILDSSCSEQTESPNHRGKREAVDYVLYQ